MEYVYQLVHYVIYEDTYTVGIYSTLDKAMEAKTEYDKWVIYGTEDYSEVLKVKLDQKAEFQIGGIGERV